MREFVNDVVRLADLTVNTIELRDMTFSNCRIVGPAVLVPLGNTSINYCTWGGELSAVFWLVEPGRPRVVGAIGATDCVFSS